VPKHVGGLCNIVSNHSRVVGVNTVTCLTARGKDNLQCWIHLKVWRATSHSAVKCSLILKVLELWKRQQVPLNLWCKLIKPQSKES